MRKEDIDKALKDYNERRGPLRRAFGDSPQIRILRDIHDNHLHHSTDGEVTGQALTRILTLVEQAERQDANTPVAERSLSHRLLHRIGSLHRSASSEANPLKNELTRSQPDLCRDSQSPMTVQPEPAKLPVIARPLSPPITPPVSPPPEVMRPQYHKEFRLDSSTTSTKHPHRVRSLFVGSPEVPVSRYRCEVYTSYKDGICYSNPTIKIIEKPKGMVKKEKKSLELGTYYSFIKIKNRLETRLDWHPLPSIMVGEVLTALQADGTVVLGYSSDTDLHYIRANFDVNDDDDDSPEQDEIFVEFNLQIGSFMSPVLARREKLSPASAPYIDEVWSACNKINLREKKFFTLSPHKQCRILQEFFQGFRDQPARIKPELCADLNDVALTLIGQKVGLCRHRAILFLYYASLLNLTARMPKNDVHAYIEVKIEDTWNVYDLGGVAHLQLQIDPMKLPEKILVHSAPPAALLADSMLTAIATPAPLRSSVEARESVQGGVVSRSFPSWRSSEMLFHMDCEETPTTSQAETSGMGSGLK